MRYFIWDTETSALDAKAKAVEIAFMEVDDDLNILDTQSSLIDPQQPISPGAAGIHGITNKDVADAPTIEEFFSPSVYGGKIPGDSVLIAHNVVFDRRFFAPWCENLVDTLCTLRLARRYFPEAENHKLQTLRYMLELDAGDAHSALGDVIAVYNLLKLIVEVSGKPVSQLTRVVKEPIFVHTMPFGMHKGMKMLEVPDSYLSWLSKLDDLDLDMKYTVAKLREMRA